MIRVLIVDDDLQLASALSDTIRSETDLEVVAVRHDADSAVAAAVEYRPEVVLMDVRMPGGGVEATRRILDLKPNVAVIGLSAHDDRVTAAQMLDAGVVAYVVKGMPDTEIVDAVRRAARRQMSLPADLGGEIFHDLSSKLRASSEAESALRASDERVRSLVEALPDALVIVGPGGKIETANAATQRLFGYPPAELVGQSIQVLVPDRFKAPHTKLMEDFLAHPRTRPMGSGIPLSARRKDGTEFPVDISLSHMSRADGAAVIVAIRDMTELKASDEARFKSERLVRALLESAPDGIVAVDARGRIQVVNARAEELFGYTRKELLGMSVDDLVPESLRAGHAGHRARYQQDPHPRAMGQELELLGRRKDGSEFPVDIGLSPLTTDEGPLVIAAVRDITERRVAEKLFAQTQQIAERRRLMAHLVRAQEEERRKIAADIHDDSIQAMTATSLRLQQLRRHLTSEPQKELLGRLDEAVRESIARLRRLMFDLRPPILDRTGLAPALRELLERTTDDIDIEWALENRLAAEPEPDLRVELYRIAQEALTNIRKHSHAKHVKLELEQVENGYHVKVTDDGAGFDVQAATGQPGHLGLIAMRERASVAGGWWMIHSRPGSGTIVDFWLPDEPLTPAAAAPRVRGEESTPGSEEGPR